jgi:hypothetical protein
MAMKKRFTMVIAGLGMLSFTGMAQALPLCGAGFGACRPGLEFGVFAGELAVEGALAKAKDGVGAIGHFSAAFESFEDAIRKLDDPSLSDDDKCAQASKEDERALAEAFRGVRDGSKLKVQQFTSEGAFNTLRNFNTMLTSFIIEVVAFNIDEVEALGGNPDRVLEARSRVTKAGLAILKGDLATAADDAQRAYDLISGDANAAPECLVGRL